VITLQRRAVQVRTFPLFRADDVSGLRDALRRGDLIGADIVAVTGKTEGEGGPDDRSRAAIDNAIRALVSELTSLSTRAIAEIPMNFSGGSGGVISPHFTVFTASAVEPTVPSGSGGVGRLVIGRGVSAPIPAEQLGRLGLVDAVAAAVDTGLGDAGITPDRAAYAMVKNPMLTPALIADAERRGASVIDPPHGLSALFRQSGGTALGAALALGDVQRPAEEQIGVDTSLYSSRVSASSGTESDRAQALVFGNAVDAPGSLSVGHAEMTDALDVAALHRACRAAGLDVPDFAAPATFAHRVAAIFVKCNPTDDGTLRGYPQSQEGGAWDRKYTTQLKASVGGMFAAALGNPAFYISGAGIHQGPPGGGSVVVIADHSA
jgi:ring-opening amidohydrolase-like protein